MGLKRRKWLLATIAALICSSSLAGFAWYRSRALQPAALVRRLPNADALVVFIDFATLRHSGILDQFQNQTVTEDAEYRAFVRKTDFDYKRDLDTAVAAFAPTGKFLLLRGRFHWNSLRSYVASAGGRCDNGFCRVQGSRPERRISFFPVQSDLMALAVSQDESAALRMQNAAAGPPFELPRAPVWLSLPRSVLQSREDLPAGTRPFAHSMESADSVTLAFVAEGSRLAAKLDVHCPSSRDAAELATQLSRTTTLLRQMIEREHHAANPADLSGVLTSGSFRNEGARVFGYWPIERAFVENLLGGQS